MIELLKSCGLENRAKLFEDEGYTLEVANKALRDDQATLLADLRELELPMDECKTFMKALAAADNAANQPKPQPVATKSSTQPQPAPQPVATAAVVKSSTQPQPAPQPVATAAVSREQPLAPQQAGPTTVVVQNIQHNEVANHNEVNITNITNITNKKDTTSVMSNVTPVFECCCAYCALTPSIACGWTCQFLCCIWTDACCKEAQEGCLINMTKCWINCTGCTFCKYGNDCCCLVGVCAVPCHKDIPCRITFCYLTICPPCGCCKKVNHAKVMTGVHGAPATCEMER